jgi:predicted RNA-binding Zn-ribbon protein involved in translation (DUF1610 family)
MRSRRPPDWLIEERRNTLGHWSAFCVSCGYAQRYFEELEHELPIICPQCAGAVITRCPMCKSRFASAFVTDCDACGAQVRAGDVDGVRIRRSDR